MSKISEGLSRALDGPFTLAAPLPLEQEHRYAILSDQHKGAGDDADEFRKCKPAYRAALLHYLEQNFTVILLGDVEELWEQGFSEVEKAHADVLQLEGSFPAGRYFRLWGNHDDLWMREKHVKKQLDSYLPSQAVYEGIRFAVSEAGQPAGTLLLLHGHQGTTFSDKLSWAAKLVLPFYRILQRLFRIGGTTPARDACLRGDHDREMYEWAVGQQKLILIAGHTHRPVWSSRTHIQQLEYELAVLMNEPQTPETGAAIARLEREIKKRREEHPPCNDTLRTIPAYFNTGCCRFDDGDITGLELEDGQLSLIKWSSTPAQERTVLESGRLADFFSLL